MEHLISFPWLAGAAFLFFVVLVLISIDARADLRGLLRARADVARERRSNLAGASLDRRARRRARAR